MKLTRLYKHNCLAALVLCQWCVALGLTSFMPAGSEMPSDGHRRKVVYLQRPEHSSDQTNRGSSVLVLRCELQAVVQSLRCASAVSGKPQLWLHHHCQEHVLRQHRRPSAKNTENPADMPLSLDFVCASRPAGFHLCRSRTKLYRSFLFVCDELHTQFMSQKAKHRLVAQECRV